MLGCIYSQKKKVGINLCHLGDILHKDELIQLHQLLIYVRKKLNNLYGTEIDKYFEEYDSLKIFPHHIHRTKAEHTYAIFLLSSAIAKIYSEYGNMPRSVSSRLKNTGDKIGKEILRKKRFTSDTGNTTNNKRGNNN